MADGEAATPEVSRLSVSVDGESSPALSPATSAESNFRELDDAFLQTQTRIWLGEVLQIRFDDQTNISDLLADGELLFEVSEVISRILPSLAVDVTHSKVNEWKSLASSKSTRRYMPYYNVGAFLQMCKNLGLDSIDLFTPSDVVEKTNTRKVCMCLRSLSKKVRLRDINVPDFDSVTCTLAMPTDMVQYIRKSLERSQSNSSLSVEEDLEKASRVKYWQRMSNSASPISNGYSDNCGDVEDGLMVSETHGSSNHTCNAASPNILGPEVAGDDESALKLPVNMDLEDEGDVEGEYLSPPESVGSPCSEYYSDLEVSSKESTCLGSRIDGKVLDVSSMEKHGYRNVDGNHIPIDLGDSSWDSQNYRDGNASSDEIDDTLGREDTGKMDINACSLLSDILMENLAQPSEIEHENNSCDNIKPVLHANSISVGDGELNVPHECAVQDDLCAGEAPISDSESFDDEQVASKDDIDKSYPYDLCVIEDDFCADETPISNLEGPDDHQMAAVEETFSYELSPDSGRPSDLSSESLTHSAELMHVGEKSCDDSLNYVKSTPEDVVGQAKPLVEHCLCSVDSGAQGFCSSCPVATKSNAGEDHGPSPRVATESCTRLLPDLDTLISANIHPSPTKNEKEEIDANMITSDHTKRCFDVDKDSIPIMDFNSFISMIETKGSIKFPDKVSQDSQKGYEDHNAVAQDIESKPINIEDTEELSEDRDTQAESVIGNDKSIDVEDTNCVNSSTATLDYPQLGADSPTTEDTSNKHNQRVETMEKDEDNDKEIKLRKPQRKLLKSVVKGTALVGIAVFLLHLRKNIKASLPKEKQQPVEAVTRKPAKPSSEKVQMAGGTGNTSNVYPAEKLRFGI